MLDHLTIVYVSSNSPPSEFQLLLLLNPYGVMPGQDEGGMLEEEGKRQTPYVYCFIPLFSNASHTADLEVSNDIESTSSAGGKDVEIAWVLRNWMICFF